MREGKAWVHSPRALAKAKAATTMVRGLSFYAWLSAASFNNGNLVMVLGMLRRHGAVMSLRSTGARHPTRCTPLFRPFFLASRFWLIVRPIRRRDQGLGVVAVGARQAQPRVRAVIPSWQASRRSWA